MGKSKEFKGEVLCGEVNAKNSFGAYIGYHRFYVVKEIPQLAQVEDPSDHTAMIQFQVFWDAMCLGKPLPKNAN